jgi:hypothetical protein
MATPFRKWRPRFSTRALFIAVTLICAYFAAWDATKTYGVKHPKIEFGPVGRDGFQSVTIHSVGEDCPMPFLIRLNADGDPSEYYFWFFGPKLKLPFKSARQK